MSIHQYTRKTTSGAARLGSFSTAHGTFDTPNFMPVGTQGSVKGIDAERLEEIGAQIMLVNTYHLWLRPEPEVVQRLGGIHKFSGWNGPILSDSGGFQVFSLQGIRKLTEEGVEFRSHIDGKKCFLSPEKAVEIQETLGVDIAMVLDECPDATLPHEKISTSLDMTHRWAKRCLVARKREETALFGITQGACYQDLRTRSAEELSAIEHNGRGFDGLAIGGLSVGEPIPAMYEVLSYHVQQLPENKVRYLMGVGTPEDIVQAVSEGVDLFDCVMPTRSGRFGRAFVKGDSAYLNIKNAMHRESGEPLDSTCSCLTCRRYTRGYLHHLFKAEEMLGPVLLSLHNLAHYQTLMREIREAIANDTFAEYHQSERKRWEDFRVATGREKERGR
jgi:queuine tRNA-ribosyltransferase